MWIAKNKDETIVIKTHSEELLRKLLNIKSKNLYHTKTVKTKVDEFMISCESDYIYMLVTNDEFEHPICTAETVKELSEKTNICEKTIHAYFSRNIKALQDKKYKIVRIRK